MSSPRYIWWSYAKAMIRQYPQLKSEYDDLHRQNVTASMTGMPGNSGATRTTEVIAIRQLPPVKQEELEAVDQAIRITQRMPNWKDRLAIIDMVLWKEEKTIEGAAQCIHCSKETAWRYHRDFVRLVGKCRGLID